MDKSQEKKEELARMGATAPGSQMPNVEPPKLTPEEVRERSFDLYRLYQISQVRESALPQFDGMGYSRWNETNEMADISYLPPKKNKGDTRITSGVTHEKDSTLLSFLLNLKFEGSVRVFYKNKELIDFGTTLTKLVRRSREKEDYDSKRPIFYRNFIAQGTSFSLERYCEMWIPHKKIVGVPNPTNLEETKWVDMGYKKIKSGCESSLIDGKKVFLENIREPNIQKQPGVYTVEYIPRELMMSIWGNSPRWKNVPFIVTPTAQSLGTLAQGSIYSDWIWGEIDFNKVEVIQVYRPFSQRYQIYINGVPMLPAKFPLKAISPSGLIPIAKGDADLMNMFAYSKSEPSKTKIDQAVFDEILQNMVMKQRQSAMVPRANLSDKIVTPDMFLGGRVVSNLDPKDVPPLIEQPGITASDFSFYKVFKEHIDSKTISSILEGQSQKQQTLGEYMDQQKKAFLKLGSKMDGIISWEKQMLKLRTYDILAHVYEKDEESDEYKPISIEDTMFDGSKGMNNIKFSTPNEKTEDDVFEEELEYEKENGTQIAFTYIDPELMKAVIDDPDYFISYEIVPVEKNNDTFNQLVFENMITKASNLFGPESLQVSRLKRRYAQVMGEVYEDVFLSEEEMLAKQTQLAQAQSGVEGTEETAKPNKPFNVNSPSEIMDNIEQ